MTTTYTPTTEQVMATFLEREMATIRVNPCAACLWRNPDTCRQCRGASK
ncbi:MAG: hypothetical protein WC455_15550 [Dehalococcoidia bacterium]